MILSNWFRKLNSTTESSLWTLLFYCCNFILQCASLKLLLLTTNLHKEYPPKDIYVDEKEVKRCIIQAKEFVSIVKPNSNNLLDLFDNYTDIKSGEHNDQL